MAHAHAGAHGDDAHVPLGNGYRQARGYHHLAPGGDGHGSVDAGVEIHGGGAVGGVVGQGDLPADFFRQGFDGKNHRGISFT